MKDVSEEHWFCPKCQYKIPYDEYLKVSYNDKCPSCHQMTVAQFKFTVFHSMPERQVGKRINAA